MLTGVSIATVGSVVANSVGSIDGSTTGEPASVDVGLTVGDGVTTGVPSVLAALKAPPLM